MNLPRSSTLPLLALFTLTSAWAQTLYVPGGTVGTSANGNVGIGTSGPIKTLDVNGPALIRGGNAGIGSITRSGLYFYDDGSTNYVSARNSDTSRRNLVLDAGLYQIAIGGTEKVRIDAAGNVGIGMTSPSSKLDVRIAAGGSGSLIATFGSSVADRIRLYDEGSTYGATILSNAGNPFLIAAGLPGSGASLALGANGTESMRIIYGGNVGIGTTTPSHKLAVNGTVRAKEVIVDTGWSDYVFDEGYRLAPLSEVETHIRDKKHLPGIPSAAEVAQGGVSLGDMQARLLAKVEELTLHQIAQNKRLDEQAAKIAALEQENRRLRAQTTNP